MSTEAESWWRAPDGAELPAHIQSGGHILMADAENAAVHLPTEDYAPQRRTSDLAADSGSKPSVVTSKAASCGHLKTGQLDRTPGQVSYTLRTGLPAIFFSMKRNSLT
jgi:hypothetical protein